MGKKFESPDQWTDGTVQEIVTDAGEGLPEVVAFMRSALKYYERYDLDFIESQIQQEGDKFYVTLFTRVEDTSMGLVNTSDDD